MRSRSSTDRGMDWMMLFLIPLFSPAAPVSTARQFIHTFPVLCSEDRLVIREQRCVDLIDIIYAVNNIISNNLVKLAAR